MPEPAPPLTFSATLRFDLVERLLRDLPDVRSVLEIGAGEGAVGARLARRYRYTGVEPDPRACEVARQRIEPLGGRMLCGDSSAVGETELFDLVCAFEVLEHVEHDASTLADWVRHVRPGGWIVLSVPPYMRRFGPSDRAVGHYRRYEPDGMRKLLEEVGLSGPRVYFYGFPIGYALDIAKNTLVRVAGASGSREERTAASGRRFQPKQALGGAITAASAPFRLLQRPFHRTRLGSGLVAVARKPV